MKAYKGFNKDMKCRGFQFEEGKAYHEDTAVLCDCGFHACLDPLDCFGHYDPYDSVYHEVEIDNVSEQRGNDTKVVAKDIKIGSRISIKDIVKASIDFTFSSVRKENNTDCVSGDSSSQAASGDYSSQAASGHFSSQAASGDSSRQAASGYYSSQAASGNSSRQAASGNYSRQAASGNYSRQAASGDSSIQETIGKNCVMMSAGNEGKAKGKIGSWIVLTEWKSRGNESIPTVVAKRIDGTEVKEDTWYTLKNGEFVEVKK